MTNKKLNIHFGFRHRFEKNSRKYRSFNRWELGVWFKKSKIVSSFKFEEPKEWKNNLVNSYSFGFELLLCRIWISWDFGGKHFDLN